VETKQSANLQEKKQGQATQPQANPMLYLADLFSAYVGDNLWETAHD
jgi:hypothetical protein